MRHGLLWYLFGALVLFHSYAWSNHGSLRNDPFNTLPDSTAATFRTNSRSFWDHEDAQREGEALPVFVVSGGIHGISSTLTSPSFATVAHTPERINQSPTVITYVAAAADVCWTIISSDNDGIAGWTRVGTTALYYQCEGDTTPNEPTLPPNSTWLMGPITITGSAIVTVQDHRVFNVPINNAVRMCDRFPGATAGEKIRDCIANIPTIGGIADARGIVGTQTIGVDIFSGVTRPITLLLGAGTYTVSVAQTWPLNGVHIRGISRFATTLRSSTNVAMWTHSSAGANIETYAEIAHLTLDGNSVGAIGLDLQKVASFNIEDVIVQGFTTAGIRNRGGLIFTVKRSKISGNAIGLDSSRFDTGTPANLIRIEDTRFISNTSYGLVASYTTMLILDNIDAEQNGTAGSTTTSGVSVDNNCLFGEGVGVVIKNSWFESNSGHSQLRLGAPAFVTCQHKIENTHVFGIGSSYGLYVDGGTPTIDYTVEGSTFQNASVFDVFDTNIRRGVFNNSLATTSSTGSNTSTFPGLTGAPAIVDNRARATSHTVNTPVYNVQTTAGANVVTVNPTALEIGFGTAGAATMAITRVRDNVWQLSQVTCTTLGAAVQGGFAFCANCTQTNPCACAGGGAWAFGQNSAWRCDALP